MKRMFTFGLAALLGICLIWASPSFGRPLTNIRDTDPSDDESRVPHTNTINSGRQTTPSSTSPNSDTRHGRAPYTTTTTNNEGTRGSRHHNRTPYTTTGNDRPTNYRPTYTPPKLPFEATSSSSILRHIISELDLNNSQNSRAHTFIADYMRRDHNYENNSSTSANHHRYRNSSHGNIAQSLKPVGGNGDSNAQFARNRNNSRYNRDGGSKASSYRVANINQFRAQMNSILGSSQRTKLRHLLDRYYNDLLKAR